MRHARGDMEAKVREQLEASAGISDSACDACFRSGSDPFVRTVAYAIPIDEQRGALRGTPGSADPELEPNATELLSCAPISA